MILKSLNTCCYKKWGQYSLYSKETLVRKVIYVKNNFVYDDFLFFKENEYSCRCTYVLSFWNIVYYSKSRIPLLPTKSGFIILYFLLSHKLRSLNHSVRPPSQSFGEDAPAWYWFRRMKNMVSGLFWSSKNTQESGYSWYFVYIQATQYRTFFNFFDDFFRIFAIFRWPVSTVTYHMFIKVPTHFTLFWAYP